MKKIITILTCLCLILTLGACSTSREEEVVTVEKTVKSVEEMKIVAPSGAPSVAFYNFSDPPVLKPMALQATLWP